MKEFIKMRDMCKKFNVDKTTIYEWMKVGLPSYKAGGTRLFEENEVNDWIMKKDSNNNPKYDINEQFIKVPDGGIGKFVSIDRQRGMITVEMDHSVLVEFKLTECSPLPKREVKK